MSRAAHDAIGAVLNLELGDPFGNATARLKRECAADSEAGATLAAAHAGVVEAGFDDDTTAQALAAVAARHGCRGATARAALDWLCLRLPRARRAETSLTSRGAAAAAARMFL